VVCVAYAQRPKTVYWRNSSVSIWKIDDRGQREGKPTLLEESSGKFDMIPGVALYITSGKVKVLET
jgi:hypothetical protein